MSLRITQKTLERLEWPQVLALLRDQCRTHQARARLDPTTGSDEAHDEVEDAQYAGTDDASLDRTAQRLGFESSLSATRRRLAETSEARHLLDAEELPPLGGLGDLSQSLRRARKGGVLEPLQLSEVRSALGTIHATARFLDQRNQAAPLLADLASTIEDNRGLEREIERCIDPGGEVSDNASRELRDARAESQRLASDLQRRLASYLRDADVAASLSDSYYTVRNDRYVLPVRAEAKRRVRGIVHDASRSGTTLFIEPEAVVELNNRLKQAELQTAREVERVLRDLSARVAERLPSLHAGLATLVEIDLAFARGRLSQQMEAVEPVVERDGIFELPQLRHPLLPRDEAVANDIRLGRDYTVLVVSGPNGGGKTVVMKAVGLAALFVRAGLHVPCDPGARVDLVDAVLADIGDEQDIRESLSTFSAHMVNLAEIVSEASDHALVVLDEIGVGTDPGEGAALAQSILETLADAGTRVIATTHYNLLKEMAAVDDRFCNASVEFDPDTLAPTYRLHVGAPGISSATAVAARMGMPGRVLERANSLLEREDRRLDHMLSELGASRAALEREQRAVASLRAESEATRDEYRGRLERLQERRDKLFHAMRQDLDKAFGEAHAQVAGVIRELQRGGTAQAAARARERLQALEERTREAEEEAGVTPDAAQPEGVDHVDWRRAKPGDAVRVPGGGAGVLESLPDRRGRVRVRVRTAVIVVESQRLGGVAGDPRPRPEPPKRLPGKPVSGGTLHCDLRGMRVEEALDRVAEMLDRAAAEGNDAVEFVHGQGTGALRRAVRQHLQRSPYVAKVKTGDIERGDGTSIAEIR